jgi:hypothetical protein
MAAFRHRVTLNNETNKKGYVMRDLTVQRINSKTKRRLFQLQFTGWPDHGKGCEQVVSPILLHLWRSWPFFHLFSLHTT